MALSASQITAYEAELTECRAALTRLIIGAQEVSVSHEGEAATYTPVSEGRLRRRIAEIEALLGQRTCARRGGISA